jgi:tetratricopeptide (TPR) repeat protein
VRPLLAVAVTDAHLEQVFAAWHAALLQGDAKAAEQAQAALLTAQQEADVREAGGLASSFLRAAAGRREAGDPLQAVALARAAVTLAPELPSAHVGLARALLAADPADPVRPLGALRDAARATLRSPAASRALEANAGATLLLALVATACLLAAVLFARRARLFLHELHHLFPRGTSRALSALAGLLLLSLPLALRLGALSGVLVLLLAVSLALSQAERAVASALLVLAGAVPLAAGALVERTAFTGTPAERVLVLEEGGVGAEAVAARLEARRQEGGASYTELHALGRFYARRGRYEPAARVLQAAAEQREPDARLLNNTGNVLFATGNLEGAVELYQRAIQKDPALAAPHFNLAELRARRAEPMEQGLAIEEKSRADEARFKALELDPALAARPAAEPQRELVNRVLVHSPLPREEVEQLAQAPGAGGAVASQLALALAGTPEPLGALGLGLLGALLLALTGPLARRLRAARACERCGAPACRRCDPEVGAGSATCPACLYVFGRKGDVPPQVRARKQLEVERHRARAQRAASTLALLVSGAGHLYTGRPVRGALYAFTFLSALGGVLLHRGLVRLPHADGGGAPLVLAPLAALLLLVHLLSIRGQLRGRPHV